MAHYVVLVNWTDQGIREFRQTTERSDAVAGLVEQMGGRMVDLYWTLGAYDLVAVIEAPDDETFTAVALVIGSQGNVRTHSLRAFTREEMTGIIGRA